MNNLLDTFKSPKGIVIGVIHFPPLIGHEGAPELSVALENALADLSAFEQGGADGVIIENNYDLPHTIKVSPGTVAAMTFLGDRIRAATTLPLGVCALWNDYEASFVIAKTIDAQFIRIPVFVDEVQTDFGHVKGDAAAVMKTREKLEAVDIRILVDIHVKHATLLSQNSIAEAAKLAISGGADGVIVTGKWTGDPPSEEDLKAVREAVPHGAIFAGSGVSSENIHGILETADGIIVSTSLKEGVSDATERNVKKWQQRINTEKVRVLVEAK